jgi:hypothetical protein
MNATKLNGKAPGRKTVSPSRLPVTNVALRRDTRRRLILRCWYSLCDIVLLTDAVRDLHRAYPGQFLTDVRTPFDDLWSHNPWIAPLRDDEAETSSATSRCWRKATAPRTTPSTAPSKT